MKRLGTMERAGLVLAAVFIVFGIYLVVHPSEAYVSHPGSGRHQSIIGHDPPSEHVTKRGARVYGFILVSLGGGMAWLAFYRPPK